MILQAYMENPLGDSGGEELPFYVKKLPAEPGSVKREDNTRDHKQQTGQITNYETELHICYPARSCERASVRCLLGVQ